MSKLISKFSNNLLLYGKIMMPKMFYLPFADIHYEMEKNLLDINIPFLNIIAPRGIAKSTLAEVKILHHLFIERPLEPKFVLIISKTQTESLRRLQAIKDTIEYSPEFREIHGYHGQHTAKIWRHDSVILDNGNIIVCKGTGQQVRGMKFRDVRPTLVIVDDPEDEHNTKTPESTDANLRWFLQSVVPMVDKRNNKIVVIGTPINQRCTVLTLSTMSNWKTIKYSYIYTDDNGIQHSIWKEMKSVKELLDEKTALEEIGKISVWYRERMCELVADETQIFKESYFKYYKGNFDYDHYKKPYLNLIERDGEDYSKDPMKIPINIFIGVDPASSLDERAAYSVIMPVAIDNEDNKYILPYFRGRITPIELGDKIISFAQLYNPIKMRIESNGYQDMLRQYVRKRCKELNIYVPGLEIKEVARDSKSRRIESMQPEFARGKIFMQKNMHELIDELLLYPNSSHKDTLDGLFFALKNIYTPYHSVTLASKFLDYRKKKNVGDWMIV